MYMTKLIDFALSMKWIWIFVLILLWNVVKVATRLIENNLDIKRETLTKDIEYDEKKIIDHIDYIINEALDQYIVLNITPKNTYYINSKIEKAIVEHLVDVIPERISPALMAKLSLVYNRSYIPKFLGEHIYMIVTNYVLDFNLNQDPDKVAAKMETQQENQVNALSEI